jgi:mRNA-binding protein PUF3
MQHTVSSTESGFSAPSGSSALTATSEAEPWARQASSWNNTDSTQTRNTPGNTSPNRTRDSVSRQTPNASSFYAQSQPHTQPSMGQRGSRSSTSHWSTGPSFDTPSSAHNVSQPGQYTVNEGPQSGAAFGQGTRFESDGLARAFPHEHRGSHDSYLNFGDTAYSNDNARALGNHSNREPQSQRTVFGDLAFDSSGAPSGHSQRGSISGLSGSFGGGGMNLRTVANPVSELEQRLNRSLSFNESSIAPSNDSGSLTAFNDSGVPSFQFNPGSQSWEAGRPQANGNHDSAAYAVNAAGAFRTNREGLPDRGSPASSAYRQSIGSPRSHAGTPQPASDAWPRPVSRDPRALGETSHRGLDQQVLAQHLPAVYPQHYYDQNFTAPLPVYGNHYNSNPGPRYPLGVPYPPQHLPVFMTGTAGLPMRPSRDADLADAQRSQLLKDFRNAYKTNRRYELRVRCPHL